MKEYNQHNTKLKIKVRTTIICKIKDFIRRNDIVLSLFFTLSPDVIGFIIAIIIDNSILYIVGVIITFINMLVLVLILLLNT